MSSTSEHPIRSVVIVGGGTAGWLAAALLSRHLPHRDCRITVVDRDDSGIGVGEATVPSLLRLLRILRANEFEFMRACDATWKLGIRFSDWWRTGHDNWHPFGVCGAQIDGRDLFPYWLAMPQRPYHSYSLQYAASLAGKSPHSRTVQSPITATGAYAFHLNAGRLAQWLRDRATESGVERIVNTVVHAEQDHSGRVSRLVLESGETLAGDFFIDCSGFDSVLLNKTLQDPWIDWSGHLLCDRAVAVRLPATAVIPPYTKAQALTSGWSWSIPLMSHQGLGYVYSSHSLSADAAWDELRQSADIPNHAEITPKFLQWKVGRQTTLWQHNVIAIGLSAGFVEPLESTGLHLAQAGVERFIELFPTTGDWSPLQHEYNTRMAAEFDEARDFVQLHYHLNQRLGFEFWDAARNLPLSSSLQHRLNLYDEIGLLGQSGPESFPDTSYYHLLTGHDRLPARAPAMSLAVDQERLRFVLESIGDQSQNALRDLPLHEEMLKLVHSSAMARAS